MQLVRTTLRDDVHLVGAEAVFCRVSLALNFEFLDSILRQNHRRGVESSISVDQPVKSVVVRSWPATIDADRIAFPLTHLSLLAVGLHRTGADE